jgi:hypothetical protein
MAGDGVLFQSLADDLFREAVGVCVGLQCITRVREYGCIALFVP